MEESIKFYCSKVPQVGEIVQVVFTKRENECATGYLTEYNGTVIMSFSQATKKKKIKSLNKVIPLNTPVSALIEDYDSRSEIGNVSRAYLDDYEETTSNNFSSNTRLYNGLQQICSQNKLDFNKFWLQKLFPFVEELYNNSNDEDKSYLDIFINNLEKLSEHLDEELYNIINDRFKKISTSNVVYKKTIGVISNNGINFTQELFNNSLNDDSMVEYKDDISIKYFNTPNFTIETKVSEELLEEFIKLVQQNSKTMNNVFVKIN